jgi:hypothetical protein
MGKASSSKKIARAARAGQTTGPNERRELGFPLIVVGIIIAGLVLVAFARTTRDAQASPTLQDHWHSAYTLYDCATGGVLPAFDSQFDPQGIHSHGDSLIHVHPFSASVTGANAQMSVFLEAMGATVEPEAITLPGGETLEAGVECEGEPTEIVIAIWEDGLNPTGEPDEVVRENFGDIVFEAPEMAYTIARVPVGTNPPPPGPDVLDQLAATSGLDRGEGVEPPNRSAVPGPQDFGTGTAQTDDAEPAQDEADDADGTTEDGTAEDG